MSEQNRERIVKLEQQVSDLTKTVRSLEDDVAHHRDVIDGSGNYTLDGLFQRTNGLEERLDSLINPDGGDDR